MNRLPQRYADAVPVEDLHEHPDNARRGDTVAIGSSMDALGFYGAVIAQEGTGEILVGNHRYRVAKARGEESVPVLYLDVPDRETALRILVGDNRTSDLAGNDDKALITLLEELAASDRGLAGTAYSDDDLRELLGEGPRLGQTDPDHIPDPPPPRATRGDVWLLGPHRLMCGDSTIDDDVARLMAGERAALMATDPPYLVDYNAQNHPASEANQGKANRNKVWDDYREHEIDDGLYEAFVRVAIEHALAEVAPIYQWHAGTRADLLLDAWAKNDVLAHQQIIWVKNRKVLTYADLMQQHEPCFYGWRRGHRPDKTRRPPVEQTTVWHVDQIGNADSIHPTQKPVVLVRWPIEWHTRRGEAIYDPFCGSGTAIIAAHMTGRVAYTLEMAPRFVDVACRRYQEHTGEVPVLEATGEPYDFTEAT